MTEKDYSAILDELAVRHPWNAYILLAWARSIRAGRGIVEKHPIHDDWIALRSVTLGELRDPTFFISTKTAGFLSMAEFELRKPPIKGVRREDPRGRELRRGGPERYRRYRGPKAYLGAPKQLELPLEPI